VIVLENTFRSFCWAEEEEMNVKNERIEKNRILFIWDL
jgi:hypothetical protein